MIMENARILEGSFVGTVKKLIVVAFITAVAISVFSDSGDGRASQKERSSQASPDSRERFDYLVRADFFAGLAGDQSRLEKAMKVCEDTLAKNPNHAEALVWHGGGLVWLAGQAFQKADIRKGTELWDRGLNEMDRAVELQPNNVGVLIPRGSVLLPASRFVRDTKVQRGLLEKAVGDYEKVLEIQKPYFAKLSNHSRSELLFGLAEGSARLGNNEKARSYFQRIVNECKDSAREKQATAWLEKGALAPTDPMSCTGCHTK